MTPDPLVLVVDDLPQNVRLLEAVLSPRGFRVVTASSGQEALGALSKEHPDVVLLDILMPGMDGYEVCRRIREDPGTAFLPVIMITASGEQEKIRAIESGADDFVEQAFRPSRVAGPGGLPGSSQAVPRHDRTSGRRAGAVEP